jgi:hypothetical protein
MFRRISLLCVVITVPLVMSVSAQAAPFTPAVATTFTGSVTCATLTGHLLFSPPLTTRGGSAETAKLLVDAHGCTGATSQGGLTLSYGRMTETFTYGSNACQDLLSLPASTADIAWVDTTGKTKAIAPTDISYSGGVLTANGTGQAVFTWPGSGGTATATGSFANSDRGVSTNATVTFKQTIKLIAAVCASTGGLHSLSVASGSVMAGP